MSARLFLAAVLLVSTADAATYRTPNFIVSAPTAEMAEKVGKAAERYRVELAKEWLGKTLPQWSRPCKITVRVGNIGAGGATTFSFAGGEVFGWRMKIQGPFDRVLDSVLPHEVSHTIFACYFRRPLPRWADEGAATLVEHDIEQEKQRRLLEQYLNEGRHYKLRTLFSFREYPKGMQNVLKLYSQGFSVVDYLILRGGKRRFLKFINDAHRSSWTAAIKDNYGDDSIEALESKWLAWQKAGSPRKRHHPDILAAQLRFPGGPNYKGGNTVVRGQSPPPGRRTFVPTPAPAKPGKPDQFGAPDPRAVVNGNPAGTKVVSLADLSAPVRTTNAAVETPPFEPAQPVVFARSTKD